MPPTTLTLPPQFHQFIGTLDGEQKIEVLSFIYQQCEFVAARAPFAVMSTEDEDRDEAIETVNRFLRTSVDAGSDRAD